MPSLTTIALDGSIQNIFVENLDDNAGVEVKNETIIDFKQETQATTKEKMVCSTIIGHEAGTSGSKCEHLGDVRS